VRRTGVFSRRGVRGSEGPRVSDVTRAPSNLAVSRAVAWVTKMQGSAEVQPLPNDKEDLGYVRNRSIPTLCITCDSSNIYVPTQGTYLGTKLLLYLTHQGLLLPDWFT
jgi:hypothetical protein